MKRCQDRIMLRASTASFSSVPKRSSAKRRTLRQRNIRPFRRNIFDELLGADHIVGPCLIVKIEILSMVFVTAALRAAMTL
jgi:hypothetical protein